MVQKRELTVEEKELYSKQLPSAEQDVKDMGYQLKSANLLLDEGLDFKYRQERAQLEGYLAKLNGELDMAIQRVEAINDALANGVVVKEQKNEE